MEPSIENVADPAGPADPGEISPQPPVTDQRAASELEPSIENVADPADSGEISPQTPAAVSPDTVFDDLSDAESLLSEALAEKAAGSLQLSEPSLEADSTVPGQGAVMPDQSQPEEPGEDKKQIQEEIRAMRQQIESLVSRLDQLEKRL